MPRDEALREFRTMLERLGTDCETGVSAAESEIDDCIEDYHVGYCLGEIDAYRYVSLALSVIVEKLSQIIKEIENASQ